MILAGILSLMVVLICYKIYILVFETDYYALNADQIDQIEKRLRDKDTFKFAVVGNIRNSLRIFEQRIAPLIKDKGVDFIISAGNAVYDGAEDKYRLLYRGLQKLDIPYLLTAGHNEIENFGAGGILQAFRPALLFISSQEYLFHIP
ncbi:MAG: metallophosphoesterase [Deltaproteobacteria bacterium]|nr:metallophosphoesterase [Deltaproteobacteria bacterium]